MGSEMGLAIQKVVHIFGLINTVSTSVSDDVRGYCYPTNAVCVHSCGLL